MKGILLIIAFWAICGSSCKKEGFITDGNAKLGLLVDTLKFDTVFTSLGSVTKNVTLVNQNDQYLRISRIQLAGGAQSPFALNVNGTAGADFRDQELRPMDSMYLFVRLTINPNAEAMPFVVYDSILIDFNGNQRKMYLQAYGRNARFINADTLYANTQWDSGLPYVLQKPLTVAAGAQLTLQKGTRVYCHANAALMVNGTLQSNGEAGQADRVVFQGLRQDEGYRDLPASWGGIVLTNASSLNYLRYTHILNAYQALVVGGGANQSPAKLRMEQCWIDNAYDIGLYGYNTSIDAVNCLVSQCGNEGLPGQGGSNVILTAGGNYRFDHCTLVTYANPYQNHKQAALYLSNADGGNAAPLVAYFSNSIIYGQGGLAENEVVTNRSASAGFEANFSQVLYKVKADPANIVFNNSLKNEEPRFDSINTGLRNFNFRLRENAPGINRGITANMPVNIDLDGNPRPVGAAPDLGCYERQ